MPLITDTMIYASARQAVLDTQLRLADATTQAQTGLRVSVASDDPAAAQQKVLLDAQTAQLVGMQAAANRVASNFDNSTRDLLVVQRVLTRAKELVVQGSNATYNAGDRLDMAAEVGALHDTIYALANRQDEAGDYVYSGFLTNTPPFDAAGNYSGDNNVRSLELSPDLRVNLNIPGSQIFTVAGGTNILAALQTLQSALNSNNVPAVQASLTPIGAATTQVSQAQASIGAQESLMNSANESRSAQQLSVANTLQNAIELNTPDAYSALIEAEAAFQAAITEAARVLRSLGEAQSRL